MVALAKFTSFCLSAVTLAADNLAKVSPNTVPKSASESPMHHPHAESPEYVPDDAIYPPKSGDDRDEFDGHKEKLGRDLVCSACAHTARVLRLELPKMKKQHGKEMAMKTGVDETLRTLCKGAISPKALGVVGDMGSREYMENDDIIRASGLSPPSTMSSGIEISMGSRKFMNANVKAEYNDEVTSVCSTVIDVLDKDILTQATEFRGRLGAFNWENWACVKKLRLCKKPIMHKVDEDDDGEDEDSDMDREGEGKKKSTRKRRKQPAEQKAQKKEAVSEDKQTAQRASSQQHRPDAPDAKRDKEQPQGEQPQKRRKAHQFTVEYSETFTEEIYKRGKEFTKEHHITPDEFRFMVLDVNGAQINPSDKPDKDRFPLRVMYVSKKTEDEMETTVESEPFKIAYGDGESWRNEIQDRIRSFTRKHGVEEDEYGIFAKDVDGNKVSIEDAPDVKRFPLSVQLITKVLPPAQKKAQSLDFKDGQASFVMPYSKNWQEKLASKMKKVGEKHKLKPHEVALAVFDTNGKLTEPGTDLARGDFPIEVRIKKRNTTQEQDPMRQAAAEKEMISDIKCDFCKLAASKLEHRFKGATFKRKEDVEHSLDNFCDAGGSKGGEGGIGAELIQEQHFVIFSPQEKRWAMMSMADHKDKMDSKEIEETWDPNLQAAMKRSLNTVCEQTVGTVVDELSTKVFRYVSKHTVIDEKLLYQDLCVSLTHVCKTQSRDSGEL